MSQYNEFIGRLFPYSLQNEKYNFSIQLNSEIIQNLNRYWRRLTDLCVAGRVLKVAHLLGDQIASLATLIGNTAGTLYYNRSSAVAQGVCSAYRQTQCLSAICKRDLMLEFLLNMRKLH